MLGPTKPRQLSAPIAASLDELDSWDHFYRHLEANLDLSFVREWGAARYAARSRSHNVVLPSMSMDGTGRTGRAAVHC
jgi:hypothetical protein